METLSIKHIQEVLQDLISEIDLNCINNEFREIYGEKSEEWVDGYTQGSLAAMYYYKDYLAWMKDHLLDLVNAFGELKKVGLS